MKKFIFAVILLVTHPSLANSQQLILTLGQQHKQALLRGTVWIEDKKLLQAEAIGSTLVLKALKEGATNIKIDEVLYHVQILHPQKKTAMIELERSLKEILGLKTSVENGDIYVTGNLYRFSDWLRLSQGMKIVPASYKMKAHLNASAQKEAQNFFSELFKKSKVPPQTLIFSPSVEIRVSSTDLYQQKYELLLQPFGIQVIKDASSIEIAPTIKVEITVAEIKRDLSLKYGLRWPSAYSAKIINTGETIFDELPFNLAALEGQGLGKVLASPNIICRSGKEAEFLAGGEFPIKIMNYKMQDIVWKRYGILLRVKPLADAAGRISLSIETEVSTVDESRKVDDVPGILTNRVSSHFDLTKPQTIALSGLIKSEDSKSSEGLPLLSRLPILGPLFSSKDFKENRSELVIFVRPSLLDENESPSSPRHLRPLKETL